MKFFSAVSSDFQGSAFSSTVACCYGVSGSRFCLLRRVRVGFSFDYGLVKLKLKLHVFVFSGSDFSARFVISLVSYSLPYYVSGLVLLQAC